LAGTSTTKRHELQEVHLRHGGWRVRHHEAVFSDGLDFATGLGWSDSEIEDAPRPLMGHLSAATIVRRTPSIDAGAAGTMMGRAALLSLL
jgi:hypothetical protein